MYIDTIILGSINIELDSLNLTLFPTLYLYTTKMKLMITNEI
jgi:hypothetical protein